MLRYFSFQWLVLLWLYFSPLALIAQNEKDTLLMPFPPAQFSAKTVQLIGGGGYALTLFGLDRLWYANQPRADFRFFDDSREWLQMDKIGHFSGAYQISRFSTGLLLQTTMPRRKALWVGGLTGAVLMMPIEIFDGFAPAYGASASDLVANTAGSALFLAQTLAWGECRIQPRISFKPSGWAKYRSNVLGNNVIEQSLKDYNGQTYWLATNVRSFAPQAKWFPEWLSVALGYGAEGMLGGHDNIWTDAQGRTFDYRNVRRYRQYYLALDIDFSKIKTRKAWVRTLLYMAGHLHVPSPTIEFNRKQGIRLHAIYF